MLKSWWCTSSGVYVPCFYTNARCRRLRALLLCFCDIFRVLINSLVCWQGRRLKAYGLFQMHGKHLDLNWTLPKVMAVEFAPNILSEGQGICTTNNNGLFYVLFLQTGAYSPLQSKEPKHSQKLKQKNKRTWTPHTHTVNSIAWRGDISSMIWKMWVCLKVSFSILHTSIIMELFYHFSPFNCCLNVVLWLDKWDYPQKRACFVLS